MSWARIDPEMPLHPKVFGSGPGAFALNVAAICYSSRLLTDGFIPNSDLALLLPCMKYHARMNAVKALLRSRLWEVTDKGWIIHDYLKYNPSKAEVLAERAERHSRGVSGGLARSRTAIRINGRFTSVSTSEPPATSWSDAGASVPASSRLVSKRTTPDTSVGGSISTRRIDSPQTLRGLLSQSDSTPIGSRPRPNGSTPDAGEERKAAIRAQAARLLASKQANLQTTTAQSEPEPF